MELQTGNPVYDVYWRLYYWSNKEFVTVVCMQDFDEYDYHQHNFVKNSEGEKYYFNSEEDAVIMLNEWFKPEEIDPEYRKSRKGSKSY